MLNISFNLKITDKKNHSFLIHRQQHVGGSTKRLPLSRLRRGLITYFSINYFQHKNFYDFFNAEKSFDAFLNTFQGSFVPGEKVKFQGYIELIIFQSTERIELESKRICLTEVFTGRYFNKFIRGEIRAGFKKRVIINGATSSSWQFKRFERISIIVTNVNQVTSLSAC